MESNTKLVSSFKTIIELKPCLFVEDFIFWSSSIRYTKGKAILERKESMSKSSSLKEKKSRKGKGISNVETLQK